MASSSSTPSLITPTAKPLLPSLKSKPTLALPTRRREFLSLAAPLLLPVPAASDEEYVKDAGEVIDKIRATITKDRSDPDVAEAVGELREASNSWVAKYRKEKAPLGRSSFRDIYSALNAVSGHYISFGPTAPIPAKRRARILEEMETAEKALKRGR